jgi:16S rRNA (guanine966-N2)-methyltransferase
MLVSDQSCWVCILFLSANQSGDAVRIISGQARGRKLAPLIGSDIRPTPDRVREALFSIVLSRLGTFAGKSTLDLFAGSGAMGLEALSRGAASALFIDQGPQAAKVLAVNLRACAFDAKGVFKKGEVMATLPRLAPQTFDLIFADPPYHSGLAEKTLHAVARLQLLAAGGLFCAETAAKEELPAQTGDLLLVDHRRYGSTAIHLYAHATEED